MACTACKSSLWQYKGAAPAEQEALLATGILLKLETTPRLTSALAGVLHRKAVLCSLLARRIRYRPGAAFREGIPQGAYPTADLII